jgi:uncharacterized protein involved in response to NO
MTTQANSAAITSIAPEQLVHGGRYLFLEPYRPFFLCGAFYAVLAVGFWFGWAEGLRIGVPLPLSWHVPPSRAHAVVMIWGVITFYVFGFLLTAYPRWVDASGPSIRAILAWLTALWSGQLLFVAGALSGPSLLIPGATLLAASLLSLLIFLGRALRRSELVERLQPAVVLVALGMGVLGLGLTTAGLKGAPDAWYRAGVLAGTYGYLVMILVSVGHRIVPFFTARAMGRESGTRRRGILPVLGILLGLRFLVGALPESESTLRIAASMDGALFLLLTWEISAWRPGRTLRNPMIGILYLGELWLLAALVGSALALLFPGRGIIDLPVLHALIAGGVATMIVGISTRVTLGHAERPIRADLRILMVFGLVQLAALTRVFLPLAEGWFPTAPLFAHWAALPWCLAFGLWLARLGPLLFK